MSNQSLELSTLVLAVVTGLSGYYWLCIGTCLMGIVLCLVDIGKRDGWIK